MDLRSPCGAAIGQMAINHDGKIYTCDEGRMLGEIGDESFVIGNVSESFGQLFDNDVTKAVCLASCAECSPRCHQCVYLPYCGVCPVINYSEEGDMFKNNGYRCTINKGILDILFSYLLNNKEVTDIFKSWIKA